MHFINHFSALAILAGPITHVLAAQTIEQITIAIQDLMNSINRANDYANGVNVLNGEVGYKTIVTNNDNVTAMITEDIDALVGTATMTKDDNDALLEAINPLADALQAYFDTLSDEGEAFLAKSQKEAVQTSADELGNKVDESWTPKGNYYTQLETLGPEAAAGVEVEQGNNDEEVDDLDDD